MPPTLATGIASANAFVYPWVGLPADIVAFFRWRSLPGS